MYLAFDKLLLCNKHFINYYHVIYKGILLLNLMIMELSLTEKSSTNLMYLDKKRHCISFTRVKPCNDADYNVKSIHNLNWFMNKYSNYLISFVFCSFCMHNSLYFTRIFFSFLYIICFVSLFIYSR